MCAQGICNLSIVGESTVVTTPNDFFSWLPGHHGDCREIEMIKVTDVSNRDLWNCQRK